MKYERVKNRDLIQILKWLENKYPTRKQMAEGLEITLGTIGHWYSGRSEPSFTLTLRILRKLEKIEL